MKKGLNSKLFTQIGVSLVSIGIGIGSGEFILWPYISSLVGFNLLIGALIGIVLQIFLNIEIQRYAFVTRKSLLEGAYGLSKSFGIWFIVSTLLGFGWPGFATSSATIISNLIKNNDITITSISIVLLIITSLILSLSNNVYKTIEKIFKLVIPISFSIILIIFINYFDINLFKSLIINSINNLDDISKSISIVTLPVLMGGVVYAGSGGNLLLLQSFYIQQKENIFKTFAEARRFQIFENIVIFGGIGLFTILMLSYLGYALTLDSVKASNSLGFLFDQSFKISADMGIVFSKLYLITGALALFFVQLGVVDLLGKITSQVIAMNDKLNKSRLGYILSVNFVVIFGIFVLLLKINQPVWLIVIGSVFNALAMAVISAVTLMLNSRLRIEFKPKLINKIILSLITIFYLIFFIITVIDIL